jgi:hypothetical protein
MVRATVSKVLRKQGQQDRNTSLDRSHYPQRANPYADVLSLQDAVGNRAVNRLLQEGRSAIVQAKLILQTAQNSTFAKNVDSQYEGVLSRFEKVQFLPVQSISLDSRGISMSRKPIGLPRK